MNDIIKKKNKLINNLFSESQRIIKKATEYVSSFSPDIFGRQRPRDCDEENYFRLYRSVSSVSDTFSDTALQLSHLEEEAKELYSNSPSAEIQDLITAIHKCSLLCSFAKEQCFTPYLNGIYEALGLDSEHRTDVNVGVIRNLTHGFSVNLKEFINNLENLK